MDSTACSSLAALTTGQNVQCAGHAEELLLSVSLLHLGAALCKAKGCPSSPQMAVTGRELGTRKAAPSCQILDSVKGSVHSRDQQGL